MNGFHYIISEFAARCTVFSSGNYIFFIGEHTVIQSLFKKICFILFTDVRQKHNCSTEHGARIGYNVEQLYKEIGSILGVNNHLKTILIGAGNLGHAIASHMSFEARGFNLIGIFDKNEALAGKLVRNIPVRHINGLYDFCRDNSPAVAVLCIPSDNAKEIVDELVKLGVKGFWNFSHYDIASDYPNVAVENVHLSDSLMTLSYHVSNL